MDCSKEVKNAFKVLEVLRYNEAHVKSLRFLGLSDSEIKEAVRVLRKNKYEIENEGGVLTLKEVPLFNLSVIKCAYMCNKNLSQLIVNENLEELLAYEYDYEEPYYIYMYRKWNGISFRKMRFLVHDEMIRKKMIHV